MLKASPSHREIPSVRTVHIPSADGTPAADFHYIKAGSGPPVIFVHGSLGDYRSWQHQIASFAERYCVIAYSRRYHWPNVWTGDGSDYSAALHATDLSALIDALGLVRPHIVSASYGSYTALIHALRRPDQVRSLVVAEPPMIRWLARMDGGAELAGTFDQNVWRPACSAFASGDLESGVRIFVDGVSGGPGTFDRFPPVVKAQVMDNAREMQAECGAERLFPDFDFDDAREIVLPVLLLNGDRSPAHFRRISDELARCLPNVRRVEIPKASHAMNAGRPSIYNEVVLGFLDDVEAERLSPG